DLSSLHWPLTHGHPGLHTSCLPPPHHPHYHHPRRRLSPRVLELLTSSCPVESGAVGQVELQVYKELPQTRRF
ncbi:hypothetical protein FB45DRAFT_1059696, partial [Roridomyces roridus]